MNKKSTIDTITQSKIDFICNALISDEELTSEVKLQIIEILKLVKKMSLVATNQKKTADLLRQAMGLLPTKEREGKKNSPQPEVWSKEVEQKLLEKLKKAFETWKNYKKNRPKKITKKRPNSNKNTDSNPEPQSTESVFQLPSASIIKESREIIVNRDIDVPNNLPSPSSSWDVRTRYDVNLIITEIENKVETLSCPITGFSKTATIEDGPAKYRTTYNAMAQLVLFVYGMGIPIVRLASTLGASIAYFSPSRIYRLCLHTAKAIAAIYYVIFKRLALCDYLGGDDTYNVVLEMRQDEEEMKEEDFKKALALSKMETDPQKANFLLETKEILGSQMLRKDKTGLKQSIFTTVVIGKRDDETIVFYHTERKSFGDVLGKILAIREADPLVKEKKCTIQSDLSSSNIPNPMPNDLLLIFLGCSAHARRPFWRYRNDENPEIQYYCYTMLLLFDKIADFDSSARDTNNEKNILTSRNNEQKPLWDEILKCAQEIQDRFAPNSEFAKFADYIVTNFVKLTVYLSDPKLSPDNNLAERLLRYEKIMLDNSKFRVTKQGRLAYDMMRTILATCQANGVDARKYLVHVLKNQMDVRQNPENYTPYAFAKQ